MLVIEKCVALKSLDYNFMVGMVLLVVSYEKGLNLELISYQKSPPKRPSSSKPGNTTDVWQAIIGRGPSCYFIYGVFPFQCLIFKIV